MRLVFMSFKSWLLLLSNHYTPFESNAACAKVYDIK